MNKVDGREVADYRLSHPCHTLQVIGDVFGVTRERVRQIMVERGVETKQWRACPNCGKWTHGRWRFCSDACYEAVAMVPLACKMCGTIVKVNQSQLLSHQKNPRYTNGGHQFCSNKCKGAYLAITTGMNNTETREKAIRARQSKSRWVSDYVWLEYLKTGLNPYALSRRLHMPNPTIYSIIRKRKGV